MSRHRCPRCGYPVDPEQQSKCPNCGEPFYIMLGEVITDAERRRISADGP